MSSLAGTQNPFEEYMSDSDDDDDDESTSGLKGMHRVVAVHRGGEGESGEGGGEEEVLGGSGGGEGDDMDSALTDDQLLLLSKLEMENKRLEEDRKAATNLSTSIPVGVNLARRASGTSLVSSNSATSNVVGLAEEGISPELSVEAGNSTEEERWRLWGKVVNDWDSYRKRTAFVKALVRQGIPQPFRGLAWQLISGASDSGAKQLYSEYMKQSSPCEKLIGRDIARTYPDHDFFREKDGLGQESLFNVMKAYSLHDREVGYCQGSAFIVGLLLMQMPEEEAFAVLVQLMQRFQLRELFKPTMQELGLSMHQLDSLVLEQLPDLHAHFQQQNFHTTMYASSWFLTLFATSLPQDLAARVMDLILAEGTIFIFQMGMAILKMSALDLMTLDMELMIRYFQNEVPQKASLDDGLESLIQSALDVKISAKKMKKWEKEYSQFKTKEDEEMVESRRLKTENKLLKQRIDHLEKESAALADRLIQGQVTRAQEAEDNFVLRREMSNLKKGESEAREQLAKTKEELDVLKAKQIGKAGFESEASEMIKALQVELMAIRLKEAESDHNVKELEAKLEEAVEENRSLQEGPKTSIASLQDELTAVKLREAEANLSLKEMKEKVTDLEMQWKNYLNVVEGNSHFKEGSKAEKKEMVKMQEDLMVAKLNENAAVASAKDHRQRLMEMETQNQVLSHQLRRQDEEISRLKDSVSAKSSVERSLRHQILEFRHRVSDLDSKLREENMMCRIKEAEHSQTVGDLQRKIAELESKNTEMVTENQLSFHDSGANEASLSALSFLVREKKRKGKGGGGGGGGDDDDDDDAAKVVADEALEGSATGLEADADALEEEIEQMRVNKRIEAQLLQDSCSRGRQRKNRFDSSLDGDDSALSFDGDEVDSDAELEAVLHSTFKEARTELDHLLFRDEKTRNLENQVLLAAGILSNKDSSSQLQSRFRRNDSLDASPQEPTSTAPHQQHSPQHQQHSPQRKRHSPEHQRHSSHPHHHSLRHSSYHSRRRSLGSSSPGTIERNVLEKRGGGGGGKEGEVGGGEEMLDSAEKKNHSSQIDSKNEGRSDGETGSESSETTTTTTTTTTTIMKPKIASKSESKIGLDVELFLAGLQGSGDDKSGESRNGELMAVLEGGGGGEGGGGDANGSITDAAAAGPKDGRTDADVASHVMDLNEA